MKKLFVTLILLTSVHVVFCQSERVPALGPHCYCIKGQGSCFADCFFSECCLCYDAGKEDGGCGCYFGIAICRSGKIETEKTNLQVSSPHSHAFFYFANFEKFLNHVVSKNITTVEIAKDFDLFKVNSETKEEKGFVKTEDYITFQQKYFKFIESLPEEQKIIVQEYVNANQ